MSKGNKSKTSQTQRQRRFYQMIVIIISMLVLFSMIFSAVAQY